MIAVHINAPAKRRHARDSPESLDKDRLQRPPSRHRHRSCGGPCLGARRWCPGGGHARSPLGRILAAGSEPRVERRNRSARRQRLERPRLGNRLRRRRAVIWVDRVHDPTRRSHHATRGKHAASCRKHAATRRNDAATRRNDAATGRNDDATGREHGAEQRSHTTAGRGPDARNSHRTLGNERCLVHRAAARRADPTAPVRRAEPRADGRRGLAIRRRRGRLDPGSEHPGRIRPWPGVDGPRSSWRRQALEQ